MESGLGREATARRLTPSTPQSQLVSTGQGPRAQTPSFSRFTTTRSWSYTGPEVISGSCFRGFLESLQTVLGTVLGPRAQDAFRAQHPEERKWPSAHTPGTPKNTSRSALSKQEGTNLAPWASLCVIHSTNVVRGQARLTCFRAKHSPSPREPPPCTQPGELTRCPSPAAPHTLHTPLPPHLCPGWCSPPPFKAHRASNSDPR